MKLKTVLAVMISVCLLVCPLTNSFAVGYGGGPGANWITQGNYYQGFTLTSPNGVYTLVLQNDGNLVIYNNSKGRAIWAAPNTWHNTDYIVFGSKYGLQCVKYDTATAFHFSFVVRAPGAAYLSMQNDGNLVIYNSYWQPLWASGTYGM